MSGIHGAVRSAQRLRNSKWEESSALRTLALSGNALTIDSVTLNGRHVAFSSSRDVLDVSLSAQLPPERQAELVVAFHGRPARGLVFTRNSVTAGYFACDWMICALEPFGEKAAFALELYVPRGMTAWGPGTLVSTRAAAQGDRWQLWTENRPYSAYLYGFALGRFSRSEDRATDVRLVYLSTTTDEARLSRLFAPLPEMLRFYQEKAGVAFPHDAYAQVHTDGDDAQEASNYAIVGDRAISPILSDPQADWVIAHELAHQWWGNLVTCTDISEFWLNEGMTSFMVAAWKEHRWGRAAYDTELALIRRRYDAVRREGGDRPLTYSGPYPSLAARRAIQYSKGALFMDRLRHEVGDDAFWKGLALYTRENAGAVVDSRDLQASFERASMRSLQSLFDAWVY